MTVDITNVYIHNRIIYIEAVDSSEEHLMRLERTRDDGFERNLTFVFDTSDAKTCKYIYFWLHRQKRVQEQRPATYKEAIHAVIGSRTDLSGRYLELD
ncbi:MAG: hypothetical protein LUE14_08595 [Clostridiales bacterium]|nr:hypothetical protein [Clostridiales bacterium]